MKKEEYLEFRKIEKSLFQEIANCKSSKINDYKIIGKLLDLDFQGQLLIDNVEDLGYIFDFLVYEKYSRGMNALEYFDENFETKSELEEELLDGMLNQHASLFEIIDINKQKHEIYLKDIIFDNPEIITLMDIGMAGSANKDILLYTRIIPIRDVFISNGIVFNFPIKTKDVLLEMVNLEINKITKNDEFTDEESIQINKNLRIFFFKLSKESNIKANKINVNN